MFDDGEIIVNCSPTDNLASVSLYVKQLHDCWLIYVIMMMKPGRIQAKTNTGICLQDELREAEGVTSFKSTVGEVGSLLDSLALTRPSPISPCLSVRLTRPRQTPAPVIDGAV